MANIEQLKCKFFFDTFILLFSQLANNITRPMLSSDSICDSIIFCTAAPAISKSSNCFDHHLLFSGHVYKLSLTLNGFCDLSLLCHDLFLHFSQKDLEGHKVFFE